jgi:hypothetical protein
VILKQALEKRPRLGKIAPFLPLKGCRFEVVEHAGIPGVNLQDEIFDVRREWVETMNYRIRYWMIVWFAIRHRSALMSNASFSGGAEQREVPAAAS